MCRMAAIEPAALLNDRYRLLRPVGRGGMGTVYEAIDLRLHNTVAVKAMAAAGDEANHAFEREARLLAALRHPALPVVSDYFIEQDARCLVMQYIEGEDLSALVRRTGPVAEADVRRWGRRDPTTRSAACMGSRQAMRHPSSWRGPALTLEAISMRWVRRSTTWRSARRRFRQIA
jgi:hypothetical protein